MKALAKTGGDARDAEAGYDDKWAWLTRKPWAWPLPRTPRSRCAFPR